MNALVDEVGDGDHCKRQCAEEIVGAGGKERRGDVPDEECDDACERDDSEEDGDGSVGSIETGVHGKRVTRLGPEGSGVGLKSA